MMTIKEGMMVYTYMYLEVDELNVAFVGELDSALVGELDGVLVGKSDGALVGNTDGEEEGATLLQIAPVQKPSASLASAFQDVKSWLNAYAPFNMSS